MQSILIADDKNSALPVMGIRRNLGALVGLAGGSNGPQVARPISWNDGRLASWNLDHQSLRAADMLAAFNQGRKVHPTNVIL